MVVNSLNEPSTEICLISEAFLSPDTNGFIYDNCKHDVNSNCWKLIAELIGDILNNRISLIEHHDIT